ncbi:MAG: hypothetical protein ACRDYF_05445 [Acidimicrobiia bacterium]
MTKPPHGTWVVREVDQATVERLAAAHVADPLTVELDIDLVADPNREEDEGCVWTRLHTARDVRVVVPGSAVVIGSDVGEWVAKVIAWDFEVSDDDPIVTLEVVPLTPSALAGALARRRTPPA